MEVGRWGPPSLTNGRFSFHFDEEGNFVQPLRVKDD
jgi:hypothetical protein